MHRFSSVPFALAILVACTDRNAPTAPASRDPSKEILDGAHNTGNAHFFFLQPMVSTPNYQGLFDASLAPTVEICVWSGTACVLPLIANFSTTMGPGSETVRLNTTDQSYIVNWHTDQFSLDLTKTYRIRVRAGGTELGHADLLLFNSAKAAKNVSTGEIISLVDGKTLPIKFRIERGAVAVLGARGGTAVFADGAVALKFTAGALPGDTGVTVTPVAPSSPQATDASVLPGTQYQFLPSPITFAQPVTLSLTYPSVLPPGVKASRLAVCKMIGGACVPLPRTRVDLASRTATASVGSFSEYAVTPFPEMCYMESSGNGWWLHTDSTEVAMPSCDGDWAPSGSQQVYQRGNGYTYELRIVNADGSGDHHLTGDLSDFDTGGARCPRWSPDGTKILFDGGAPHTTRGPAVINPDGSGAIFLTAPGMPLSGWDTNWCAMWWTGNSQTIAFRAFNPANESAIWLINVDGTGLRKLINESHYGPFAASADGSQFAFYADWAGDLVGSGVYTINSDGSGLRRLPPQFVNGYRMSTFDWSPIRGDNRLVVESCGDVYEPCSSSNGFGPGIWIVNGDGTDGRLLVPSVGSVSGWPPESPRWSPDGQRIAFTWVGGPIPLDESAGSQHSTYIVNANGSGLQLLLGTSRASANAIWRP